MSAIPCLQNEELQKLILDCAEVLKTDAHKLGAHGLNEQEFYNSGVFRGAIERIRGQFSATMRDKAGILPSRVELHAAPGVHSGLGLDVEHQGAETMRKMCILRGGAVVKESKLTAIQRA